MPPKEAHHHRSSTNVAKRSFKGPSKNAARRAVGKTEELKVSQKSTSLPSSKADRINRAKQIQENKREDVIHKKRLGSRNGPPKMIGIVLLSPNVDLNSLAKVIGTECTPCKTLSSSLPFVQTMSAQVENREGRFTYLMCPRDPVAVADVAKTADILYLVMAPQDDNEELNVDMLGNHFIQVIKAQGIPAIAGIVQGVDKMDNKTRISVNKLLPRYFKTVFDDEVKYFNIDNQVDMKAILRWTYHVIPRSVHWRNDRCRLLGEHVEYISNKEYAVAQEHQHDESSPLKDLFKPELGTIRVTGFLRGEHSLSANQLVHITGFGDFPLISIEGYHESVVPPRLKKSEDLPVPVLLSHANEDHESMQDLLPINGGASGEMGNEHGIITDEEFNEAKMMNEEFGNNLDNTEFNALKTQNTDSINVYHDWKYQDLIEVPSKSSLVNEEIIISNDKNSHFSETMSKMTSTGSVILTEAEVSNAAAIAQTKGQDERGIINSVWDTLDDEEEAANHPVDYLTMRNEKKSMHKEALQEEGLMDDAASVQSNFTGMTLGSLRNGINSKEELAQKFSELPYHEKVSRLMKYGTKGEDKLVKEKRKLEKSDVTNKDEVDFDPSITARSRFMKYRGVKSFKHSAWDANENLPLEYSQIYQFANFDISSRNAKEACLPCYEDYESMDDTARYINGERAMPVTLTIGNVSKEASDLIIQCKAFALVWGLFKHERKVTVMHTFVKRHEEYTLPVKNNDPMHIQVGFRRFTTAPMFSKVVNGTDKTLIERFLPNDNKFYLASFYGRVCMPPSTVLMFSAQVLGSYKSEFPFNPLVASGTLQSCNPNKIVLKRAVLTGFPLSVSNSHAVVRHMFFNANDVRWFKPVEVWTRSGRHGHITEPRGLHGLFKCSFDNTLKHKEPVCMSLYKRHFPVWNPQFLG